MRQIARWALGFLLLAALALAVGTFVPRGPEPARQSRIDGLVIPGEGPASIRVVTGVIHTDIAVPIERVPVEWLDRFAADGLPVDHPQARWFLFGWGSRAIYPTSPQFSDMTIGALFRAFTYDQTSMRVAVLGPVEWGEGTRGFSVPQSRLWQLLGAIDDGFEGGIQMALAQPGYGPDDRFYDGTGWFNALVGCNTWAAETLRQGGITTGLWNPLPQTLLISLDVHSSLQEPVNR
ncbi:MAG: TIGR02117 family protein [Pseudomonadota bacterium]